MGLKEIISSARDGIRRSYRNTPNAYHRSGAGIGIAGLAVVTYLLWPSSKPAEAPPVYDAPAAQTSASAPAEPVKEADKPAYGARAAPVVRTKPTAPEEAKPGDDPKEPKPEKKPGDDPKEPKPEEKPALKGISLGDDSSTEDGKTGGGLPPVANNIYQGQISDVKMHLNSADVTISTVDGSKTFGVDLSNAKGLKRTLADIVNNGVGNGDGCKKLDDTPNAHRSTDRLPEDPGYKNRLCVSRYLIEAKVGDDGTAQELSMAPEVMFNGKVYTSVDQFADYVISIAKRLKTISDPTLKQDFQTGIRYGRRKDQVAAIKDLGQELLAARYALGEYATMTGVEMPDLQSRMTGAVDGSKSNDQKIPTPKVLDVMYRGFDKTYKGVGGAFVKGLDKIF